MRKFFLLLLLIATLSTLYVVPGITPAQGQELPVPREETVVIPGYYDPPNWDHFNPYIPSRAGVMEIPLAFEGLWYFNYTSGEIIYWLCTGWEYKNNNTQLIIHVRDGVTWNDGEPFTAKDIVFTINMLKEHSELYGHAMVDSAIESATAPDDLTAVLNLKAPNPRIHYWFRDTWGGIIIVPEHIWKNVDPTTFLNNPPVTTGPYKLNMTIPELRIAIWERNENYWAKSLGYFPGPKYIVYKVLPSVDVAVTEFSKGDIDVLVSAWIDWPVLKSLKSSFPDTTALVTITDPFLHALRVNCAKYPFNMSDFRWALSYAIDRERVGAAYTEYDYAPPAKFPFPSWDSLKPYMYPDVAQKYNITYDPDKANQILDSLGFIDVDADGFREYPNGTKFSFEIAYGAPWRVNYEYALVISQCLKEVGLNAYIQPYDVSILAQKCNLGLYDTTTTWGLGTNMPWNMGDPYFLISGFHSKYVTPIGNYMTGGDSARLSEPEMDEIIDELSQVGPSDPEYSELAHKAVEVWMKYLPIIPLTECPRSELWNTKYWTGWPTNSNLYAFPYYWCPNFIFILFKLEPVAHAPIVYSTVWFTKDVEAFTGADGKTYGPFTAGSSASIPLSDAETLVENGYASFSPPVSPDISTGLTNLQTSVADLQTAVTNLNTAVTSLEAEITDLKTTLTANLSTMQTLLIVTIILEIVSIVVTVVVRKK